MTWNWKELRGVALFSDRELGRMPKEMIREAALLISGGFDPAVVRDALLRTLEEREAERRLVGGVLRGDWMDERRSWSSEKRATPLPYRPLRRVEHGLDDEEEAEMLRCRRERQKATSDDEGPRAITLVDS